jgi:hypothetical protein
MGANASSCGSPGLVIPSSVKDTLPTLTADPATVTVTLVPVDDMVEDAPTPDTDVGATRNEEGNTTRMAPPMGMDLEVVNATVAAPDSPAFVDASTTDAPLIAASTRPPHRRHPRTTSSRAKR